MYWHQPGIIKIPKQNELLSIMSNMIVRGIIAQIKASGSYCIMIDESTDNANKEWAAFCPRWVDEALQPNEEFLGLYQPADSLVHMIKDCLLRFGLRLANSWGQCYDCAAAMAGKRKGVATQISAENQNVCPLLRENVCPLLRAFPESGCRRYGENEQHH